MAQKKSPRKGKSSTQKSPVLPPTRAFGPTAQAPKINSQKLKPQIVRRTGR